MDIKYQLHDLDLMLYTLDRTTGSLKDRNNIPLLALNGDLIVLIAVNDEL